MIIIWAIFQHKEVSLLLIKRIYSSQNSVDRKRCQYILKEDEDWYWQVIDQFTYFDSNIASTKSDVNTCLAKARTAIERLLIRQKSDLSDKIKQKFFQAVAVLVLLYGCTISTLKKKTNAERLDWNKTKIQLADKR